MNTKEAVRSSKEYMNVPIVELTESSTNPRKVFDEERLEELAGSIRSKGVLSPLLVRRINGHFEIVTGARRYRAAQRAGLDEIPVRIGAFTDEEALEIQIIELSIVRNSFLCWPRLGTSFTCKRCAQINISIPDGYRRKQVVCVRDCALRRISTMCVR